MGPGGGIAIKIECAKKKKEGEGAQSCISYNLFSAGGINIGPVEHTESIADQHDARPGKECVYDHDHMITAYRDEVLAIRPCGGEQHLPGHGLVDGMEVQVI